MTFTPPDISNCTLSMNFLRLFEDMKGVLFFVKDLECRLVYTNLALAEHLGFETAEELIGLNDFDIFPREQAERYREDDRDVIDNEKEKKSIVELFPNYLGDFVWFSTHKIPLFDKEGRIWGLCGILQTYEDSLKLMGPLDDIHKALEYMHENFTTKISNKTLADIAGVSIRQFEKRFKQVFHSTAHNYILKLRILSACDLLLSKNVTITELALDLGFYDQSAFSRTFKKQVGLSPMQYIKKHKK